MFLVLFANNYGRKSHEYGFAIISKHVKLVLYLECVVRRCFERWQTRWLGTDYWTLFSSSGWRTIELLTLHPRHTSTLLLTFFALDCTRNENSKLQKSNYLQEMKSLLLHDSADTFFFSSRFFKFHDLSSTKCSSICAYYRYDECSFSHF